MRDLIKRIEALEQTQDKNERYLCEYEDGTQERLTGHELLLYPLFCRNEATNDVKTVTKIYCRSADDPFVQVPLCILKATTDRPCPEIIVIGGD